MTRAAWIALTLVSVAIVVTFLWVRGQGQEALDSLPSEEEPTISPTPEFDALQEISARDVDPVAGKYAGDETEPDDVVGEAA